MALAALVLSLAPAFAHPHVWIVVRSQIQYGSDGKISGVQHAWTFDEGFSTYLTQGLDKDKDGKLSREELSGLAKENVESLVDSNYFTVAKANGKPVEAAAPKDYFMEFDGKQLTLTYVLPLRAPAVPRLFSLEVYDPGFFISFIPAPGDDAVTMKDAPKGCTVSFRRPKQIDDSQAKTMTESFFNSLSASSDFGAQFASRALVACP